MNSKLPIFSYPQQNKTSGIVQQNSLGPSYSILIGFIVLFSFTIKETEA